MSNNLLVLPLIIPLISATFGLFWKKPSIFRRAFILSSALLQLYIALYLAWITYFQGVISITIGKWTAPFGIALTADLFSCIMLSLCSFLLFVVLLYRMVKTPIETGHPIRLSLINFFIAGANLAFITGDFFNLYVAYEIMLIASYGLLILNFNDHKIHYAFPYIKINLIGSTFFLCTAGLVYSVFGSLNMADISVKAMQLEGAPILHVIGILMLLVFGIKSGFFPLFYWLPNSYPKLPPAIMALFAAVSTKVGLYTIIRMFGTLLPHSLHFPHHVILYLSVPTMLFGVGIALSRGSIKKILCLHVLSQIGVMMLAIGFFTQESLGATIFYMIHHTLVISSLILIAGIVTQLIGTDTLKKTANIWLVSSAVGIIFLLQAFSLAGLPPLSGFWGKFWIIKIALEKQAYVLTGIMIVTSVLTISSMLKIWVQTFWKVDPSIKTNTHTGYKSLTIITCLIVSVSLFIGLSPQFFINLSEEAARQLFDKKGYVSASLKQPKKEINTNENY